MRRTLLLGKIHRAVVTHADLHYEGSVTIDVNLLDASGILPNEVVHVWNVTNGSRLQTYALAGERGSGVICLNGAAAHLTHPGDLVIIAAFAEFEELEARAHQPRIVRVDERNCITSCAQEVPGPEFPVPLC